MVFGIDGQGVLQETQRQVILHHTMKHQTNIALHQRERITVRGGLSSTSLNLRNSISSHQPFGGYISTLDLIFFAKLRMSIGSAPKAYIEQSHFRMVLPTHHEHEVASAVQQLQGSGQLAIGEAVQS